MLEIREHKLGVLKQRVEQTTHYRQKEEVDALTASIGNFFVPVWLENLHRFLVIISRRSTESLKKKIEECMKIEKENAKKVTEFENKMNNIQSLRDRELKSAEAEMKRLKKKSDDSRNAWQQREQVR